MPTSESALRRLSSMTSAGEFIMGGGVPVSEAAMQFFVEAMRANTNVLETVNKTMLGMQEEQKETLRQVVDVRERVIRIEALPRVEHEMSEIKDRLTKIEMQHVQDAAKAATWTLLMRHGPTIMGIIVTIIASVMIILIASGRVVIPPAGSQADKPPALSADQPAPRPSGQR